MTTGSDETSSSTRPATGVSEQSNGSSAGPVESIENDLHLDEKDPSRVAPSAEGIVTFAGLSPSLRKWLADELNKVGRNGNGRRPSGPHADDDASAR